MTILADTRRLRQMLFNLLSNAVKFTPKGGEVTVAAVEDRRRLRGHGQRHLHSIGMSHDDIPKGKLERFGQIDSRLSRRYEGTGLGLPLTKEFAELHGATLSIRSEPRDQDFGHDPVSRERRAAAIDAGKSRS